MEPKERSMGKPGHNIEATKEERVSTHDQEREADSLK